MLANDQLDVEDMVLDMEHCMRSFEQVTNQQPTVLDAATALLRVKLHQGEDYELTEALADGNLVEQFDACLDLLYVVFGTMVANGTAAYLAEGWKQVHANNMSKLVDGKPLLDAAGKFVKPEGFEPVDLKWILTAANRPSCFGGAYTLSVDKCRQCSFVEECVD